jgi:hypothetical protein
LLITLSSVRKIHQEQHREYRKDIMKKRTKEIVESLVLTAMALICLACGCFAWDLGQEGKAIFLIMCSLYVAMWVHAGLVGIVSIAKFVDKKEETSNSEAVAKSPSTNAEKSDGAHR